MAEIIQSSVNIVEVCKVTPPPGSAVPASLPLTFFDIFLLRYPPVKCIYFYKSPTTSFDVVVSNLKTSLSLVLQHYLPLAGAIVWPENAPKPTLETLVGDGVELTVAKSNADFSDLISDGLREVEELHPLVPMLLSTESRATAMAVQVTSFGTHGFCIGLTTHHAVMDGRCATSFHKFWACKCKSLVAGGELPTAEMMPLYDRSKIADPAGLEDIFLSDWLAVGGSNNRSLKFLSPTVEHNLFRGTFKLNLEQIKKLKQFVLNRQNLAHISTLTVVMAYTLVCSTLAENSFDDGQMILCVIANARRRLHPPLPENYFGNCIVDRYAIMEKGKLVEENGVITAVDAISKAIKSLEDGVLNGAEKLVKMLTQPLKSNQKMLYITGSPRFVVYDVNFGWGTPEKVVFDAEDNTITVCEHRDSGLELGWVGKRDVINTFAAAFAKGLEEL